MKRINKLGGLFLALCIIFSTLSTASFASSANYAAPEVLAEKDGKVHVEPYSNYNIINEAITQRGVSWQQPSGYHAYRVWVDNTTNQTMTVTVSSTGGTFVETVPANSGKVVIVVNNAWENVTHTIDFQTSSGIVSGTVAVRVSDTDLSW